MKKISLYTTLKYGKKGKKLCRGVIDMAKIWQNTGKIGKILKVRFLPRFLPEICQRTFDMQSGNFAILPILPPNIIHTQKKIFFRPNGCSRDRGSVRASCLFIEVI